MGTDRRGQEMTSAQAMRRAPAGKRIIDIDLDPTRKELERGKAYPKEKKYLKKKGVTVLGDPQPR